MGKLSPRLPQLLREHGIPVDEGTLALMGLTHSLDVTKSVPEDVVFKLVLAGFIERVYPPTSRTHLVKINVSVYEEQETEWMWVEKEYMKLFQNVNPKVQMAYEDTMNRMIRFFQENPSVRKDDVIKAAKLYLSEVDDIKYVQAPHYFIKKGSGVTSTSRLSSYLDKLKKGSGGRKHTVR